VSFSKILELKKSDAKKHKESFVQNLIIGNSLYAIAAFYKLEKQFPGRVKILNQRDFLPEDLVLKGPKSLRGTDNISVMEQVFPELAINRSERPSLFYKDQKLREFGGRARPESLLFGEAFYGQMAANFIPDSVFPFLKEEDFLNKLNSNAIQATLLKITKREPSDLVDRARWQVELASQEKINCENLIWARSPHLLLDAITEKEHFSDQFISLLEQTRTPVGIYVRLEFDKPVTDLEETLFIPLSFTHEWGHFIGEFEKRRDKQIGEFITSVDPEVADEDHVAKIIKILKKNLEKIIPATSTTSYQEFIHVSEAVPCLKFDDMAFHSHLDEGRNIVFVGPNAYLKDPILHQEKFEDSGEMPFDCTHVARGVVSLQQLPTC